MDHAGYERILKGRTTERSRSNPIKSLAPPGRTTVRSRSSLTKSLAPPSRVVSLAQSNPTKNLAPPGRTTTGKGSRSSPTKSLAPPSRVLSLAQSNPSKSLASPGRTTERSSSSPTKSLAPSSRVVSLAQSNPIKTLAPPVRTTEMSRSNPTKSLAPSSRVVLSRSKTRDCHRVEIIGGDEKSNTDSAKLNNMLTLCKLRKLKNASSRFRFVRSNQAKKISDVSRVSVGSEKEFELPLRGPMIERERIPSERLRQKTMLIQDRIPIPQLSNISSSYDGEDDDESPGDAHISLPSFMDDQSTAGMTSRIIDSHLARQMWEAGSSLYDIVSGTQKAAQSILSGAMLHSWLCGSDVPNGKLPSELPTSKSGILQAKNHIACSSSVMSLYSEDTLDSEDERS